MVDQFIYLASNIAATESNVNISALAKATVERLSLIWKSNLPVGMKKKKAASNPLLHQFYCMEVWHVH